MAGDASAPRVLAAALGPHVSVYNRAELTEHVALGAGTWVAPLELSLDAVVANNPAPWPGARPHRRDRERSTRLRPPAARLLGALLHRAHHRLNKDECDFRCRDDADSLLVASSEG